MEGFICPNCRLKFNSAEPLLTHFNSCTGLEVSKDNKVQIIDVQQASAIKLIKKASKSDKPLELQSIGQAISYNAEFYQIRNQYNSELSATQNRALLRLYKLIKLKEVVTKSTSSSLRDSQQNIVSWEMDSKACSICSSSFNIFRRQHHCRICGCSICDDCTTYISYDLYFVNEDLDFSINNERITNPSAEKVSQLLICIKCNDMFDNLSKQAIVKSKSDQVFIKCYKEWIHSADEALRLVKSDSLASKTLVNTLVANMDQLSKQLLTLASDAGDKKSKIEQQGKQKLAKAIRGATISRLEILFEIMNS